MHKLSLAQVIALARQASQEEDEAWKKEEKEEEKEEEKKEEKEEDMIFLTTLTDREDREDEQYAQPTFEIPNYTLFLSLHAPYLLDPYSFNVVEFREYRKWLLSPSLFVIGTFPKIDSQRIFDAITYKNPPTCILDLHRLAAFLWELDLMVPQKFEEDMIKIIQQGKKD